MTVQPRRPALTAFVEHPLIWGMLGVPLLVAWSGTMVAIRWNAIEMMIGANLLAGRGPIVAVLDPPALWRPPLGWLLCAAVETLVRDPFRVFQVLYTVSLATCAVTGFYLARKLWGLVAAHAVCVFILGSSGVTALLVDHGHGLSHVAFLMAIVPAIAATVLAMERPSRRWMSLAGVSWAVTGLARPESVVAFLISGGFLLYASWRLRRVVAVLWLGAAYLLVVGPYALYSGHVRAHYGIAGPSALTTFYASEAWVSGDGNEDAGFARAVARYGPAEEHGNSLIRFLARRPGAGYERVRRNLPGLLALYTNGVICHVVWFVALPFALIDFVWLKRQRRAYLYCLALFAGSFAVCLFHVDARYATLGVPALMLVLGGGISAFWELARRTGRTWAVAIASLGLLAGGAGVLGTSLGALGARVQAGRYGQARHAVRAVRTLAEDFRAIRPGSPDVLVIRPEPASAMAQEYPTFLASYFAGTALPWFPGGSLPRDTIFSMVPKRVSHAYLPESALHRTNVLLHRRALSAVQVGADERYYLFDDLAAPTPLADLDAAALDALAAILRRDHPRLADEFEADRSWARAEVRLRHRRSGAVDRVGCAPLAVRPDGRPDAVFVVELSGIPSLSTGDSIESISLERQSPFGVWSANGSHFFLGVAPRGSRDLLNQPDGTVRIALERGLGLRLFACDDGADTPSSAYRARVRIGSRSLVSGPVNRSASD